MMKLSLLIGTLLSLSAFAIEFRVHFLNKGLQENPTIKVWNAMGELIYGSNDLGSMEAVEAFHYLSTYEIPDNSSKVTIEVFSDDLSISGPFEINFEDFHHTVWISDAVERPFKSKKALTQALRKIYTKEALWITPDSIAWDVDHKEGNTYTLHKSEYGDIFVENGNVFVNGHLDKGTAVQFNEEFPKDNYFPATLETFSNLQDRGLKHFSITADISHIKTIAKGQVVLVQRNPEGLVVKGTNLKMESVLRRAYEFSEKGVGLTIEKSIPTFKYWAPKVLDMKLRVYQHNEGNVEIPGSPFQLKEKNGYWSIVGDPSWMNLFYEFEISAFSHKEGRVVNRTVIDPIDFESKAVNARGKIDTKCLQLFVNLTNI